MQPQFLPGPSDSLLRCHQQSGEILRQQEDAIEMDEAVQAIMEEVQGPSRLQGGV